ncbi:restriction endonuclease subunit S [Chryseobacterium shandongense]|uniref:restriction endonuclease subunit S n=1 Tax=Chryseobacterium shandongense TaxID=1493872 RepID=UPI000F4E57FA|nr:restriction endonuclease subunit S [Chryseobacterium shandongense]AZA56972.1 restriction endonuclease subunit S [Chryseobacterium shandongense]
MSVKYRTPVESLIIKGKIYIGDGYRAKNSELGSNGLPFARAGNLNNGFNFQNADFFPLDMIKKVGNKLSEIGDVVFTSKGTIGRFGFVTNRTQQFVYSPQLCFWRSLDYDVIYPKYLFYWMNSPLFLDQVSVVSGLTDMAPYVNLKDQRKMLIDLPSLPIQQKIASILSSYDELIENNKQRIKLLEEMAEEIYKEWFVRLRFPGYENATIEDGLPGGWEELSLGNVFDISLGGTPSRENNSYWNGHIPWINSGKVNNLRVIEASEFITELGLKKSATKIIKKKSTLLAITGATLGQVSLLEIDACTNQSVIGIKDPTSKIDEFIFLLMKEKIKDLINYAGGGAQQHINKSIVESYKFILPASQILLKFEDIIKPQFELISTLLFKNQLLQETRDLLLPRLINGKLSMEQLVEEELGMVAEERIAYNKV